eukprot:TRINITY_DN1163_c0_g1_i4.p2 TRINITY_DN1163_c0_g1~~TRINITY_DN1163_c0_g1_i4.p2  ORF type:complete len:120 (-),score=34.47 TRINITY_DN1163_c0_g1_i4:133-492(-)
MTLCDWVSEGNIEKVKTFLFQDLEGVLNFKDELGRTGLHWAADGGNLELTELFLNSGARVNDQDVDGQTPLHYACTCGHERIIQILLQHGADPKISDMEGQTPLQIEGGLIESFMNMKV